MGPLTSSMQSAASDRPLSGKIYGASSKSPASASSSRAGKKAFNSSSGFPSCSLQMDEGFSYKDKVPSSRIAAAWGYTRRTGLSHSLKAHWASRRGKKLLIGLFLLLLSLCIILINIIRLSTGVGRIAGKNGGKEGHGLLVVPDAADIDVKDPAPIDLAAKKNVKDRWEHPAARRLHLTPSDLEDEEMELPMLLPVGVSLQGTNDLNLELCQVDLAPYHRNPEKYPMSNDLVRHFCSPKRKSHKLASELAKDESKGKQLEPTGFIFHESRVGSTLVANMLGSIPTNLVYSEPHVPFSIVHECSHSCSEDETVRLLKMAILSMARSHHHEQMFIKFQSSFIPHMHLVLKAFPNTPWIFIYRDPVEIIVSNFKKGNGNGPCIRSKRHAPEAVQRILGTDRRGAIRTGDEEYCAAHLAMLCDAALDHIQESGSMGQAVAYESLVDDVMNRIIPGHFGVAMTKDEYSRMKDVSELYSKSRDNQETFVGDTKKKHEAASAAMEQAAEKYLKEPTELLRQATKRGLHRLEHDAKLRAQEAHVYERTGSKFFHLPHCPDEPAYPPEVPIIDMVRNWNPDDISIPARHYNTLCRIDYQKEYEKALRYRDAEMPFIVYNVPQFEKAVEKWNTPGYLERKLGDGKYHVTISKDNHFMYYHLGKKKKRAIPGYVPPTQDERWTYGEWLKEARKARNISTDEKHYYFRVSDGDNPTVREDLSIFDLEPSLFMKEPEESRGVHCRFGMRGVIAEGHFDASRNMVALVSGTRRWILAHPRECKHAYMLPIGHPSARHSQVDWSSPDLEKYPDFVNMKGHEVILTPGEILNVPAWWIHYISNLDINIQCNSRSGDSEVGLEDLAECGFQMH